MSASGSSLRRFLRLPWALLVSPLVLMGSDKDLLTVRPSGQFAWTLEWQGRTYRCAVGKHGVAAEGTKREGDGKTPAGAYPLRGLYYRADKLGGPPETQLPVVALSRNDGWCDAPGDPKYNRFVTLPFAASHERLWRDQDDLYDLIVPIGYNDDPVVPGMGSAIFLHVAASTYSPTAGCVALSKQDFLEVLRTLRPTSRIRILPPKP